jgi:branched-chain amino acid aminotransferase
MSKANLVTPFDRREGKIWLNGEFVEWGDAKVHILSHGLNYGSSVFEGIRIYNGRAFKLKEHLERLENSAKTLGLALEFTLDEMMDATNKLISYNNLSSGYIRPLAWRGTETMLISGEGCKINLAIAAWKSFDQTRNEAHAKGVKLCVSEWRKPAPDASPYFTKASCIYTISTIIKNTASAKGFDDAIILDGEGYITEASTSNFFAVFDNELHTPIPDCFLDGITRKTVIELAKANNITVVERKIKPEELVHADAAFLTGTAIEIMPIASINEYNFDVENPLIAKITDLYHMYVTGGLVDR